LWGIRVVRGRERLRIEASWSPGRAVSDTLVGALPPLNPTVQALLAVYRRQLEEHLGERLVKLTLFGSYARGQARADSDIDVAVVLDRINRPADRVLPMELAGDLIAEHGLVIAPLVLSVSELELLHRREDLLAENLDREGIAI
jgi:uncharacterized protein